MEPSEDVLSRKDRLVRELEDEITKQHRRFIGTHRIVLGLMVTALCCSVASALGGIFLGWTGKEAGGLAALPPLIAFIAVNLKLEGKSNWHCRMTDGLNALRSRLLYQMPLSPAADDIASVAKDRDTLRATMQVEWDKTLTHNWSALLNTHG